MTPFDAAGRAREIVREHHDVLLSQGIYLDAYPSARSALIDAIAAALTAARDEERERCATIAEAQAYAEECADDTMAGVTRGKPFRNLAAGIRGGVRERDLMVESARRYCVARWPSFSKKWPTPHNCCLLARHSGPHKCACKSIRTQRAQRLAKEAGARP